jgi:malonyl-CoA O-methyltransferase
MNSSTSAHPCLDRVAAVRERQLFTQRSPWLHDTVAQSMVDRLRWMKEPAATWLDWEPTWGGAESAKLVAQVYPQAQRFVYEGENVSTPLVKGRWGWLSGRRSGRRFWDGSSLVDMVWANMALRGESEPQALMQRWGQALKPQGFVMFTGLGPHTLATLGAIYERHGWGPVCAPWTDMHDWGDMLVAQGFENPVMDSSFINLSYATAARLLADLRLMGRNTHPFRHGALRSRQWLAAVTQVLEAELERDQDGRLLVTIEVIQGHAVNPVGVRAQGTVTAISEAQMRGLLRQR